MYKFHDTEMPQPAQNSVMLESWIHLLLLMSFNCFQSLSWCIISSCCVSSCYITACYTTTCATRESLHPLWSQYPAWEDVLAALLKWTDHVHAMWAWHRLKTWERHVPPPPVPIPMIQTPLDHHGCQRTPHFFPLTWRPPSSCGCQQICRRGLREDLMYRLLFLFLHDLM